MDVSEFTKATGTYLKPEEVKKALPNAIFVIIDEAKIVDSPFKDKKGNIQKRIQVEGEFNKEARIFDMNKTNARTVEKALGSDSKKWIGAQLVLEVYKTRTGDSLELKDAINVKEVKK